MTAAIDITTEQRKTLLALLRRFIPGVAVWVYGSRVKWTARPNSDLDLVAFTTPAQRHLVSELKEAFDESNLPFLVDFHVWDEVPERFHEIIRKEYVVLQEVEESREDWGMACDYPITCVGDLADSISETYKTQKEHLIFLNTSDIFHGKFLHRAYTAVKDWPGQAKKSIRKDDILFSEIRPANGRWAFVEDEADDYVVSTKLMVIRARKDCVLPKFLYQFLTSTEITSWLQHLAESRSGTFPQITFDQVASLELPLPPLPEQKAIAHILGTLDDKIELNRRMNVTLEALALALFQSWFVDFDPVRAKLDAPSPPAPLPLAGEGGRRPGEGAFGLDAATAALFPAHFQDSLLGHIPQGWEVGSLDQIAHFLNGLALQKYPPGDGATLPVIKIAQLRKGDSEGADRCNTDLAPQFIVEDGDVLFSWSGSLEVELWCGGRGALNQHLFKVTSPEFPKWFYYLWTLYHLDEFRLIAADKATTMGHIQRRHLTAAKVLVPPPELLTAMTRIMAPLIDQIIANRAQSRTLAALRDTLLPKLLSGELSLPAAMLAAQAGVTGIESKLAETVAESATVQTRKPVP